MLSPETRNSAVDFLCKETAAARRRRLALRLQKLHITKPHKTSKTTSFSSFDYKYSLAVHGGGSGGEPNPSRSSTASLKGGTKSGPAASSESSSSTMPFRRLDGDIRRHAGIPLTGEDIVDKDNKARGVNCSAHGSISVIGRRRVMEDTLTVAPSDFPTTHDFFGVYDGHGGVRVSSACRDHLHRLVGEEIEGWRGQRVDWDIVMRDCFKKMDDEVSGEMDVGFSGGVGGFEFCWPPVAVAPLRVRTVGATALVVVLSREEIVVANCGDSRAVLFRNGDVLPLSCDHKVDRLDERERVEASGGKVIDINGLFRVQGVFKTTRSIGDHGLKSYMISDPEITVTQRNELDEFIIIATDGVWDVVSNDEACEVVEKCLAGHTKRTLEGETTKITAEAAAIVAELAMAKGSKDNISVIVVEFMGRSRTLVS